jgi:hypothetical protein
MGSALNRMEIILFGLLLYNISIIASDFFSTRKVGKILEKISNFLYHKFIFIFFFLKNNNFKKKMLILPSNLIILGILG